MARSTSCLISNSSSTQQQKWVDQISTNLENQLVTDFDPPVSIFQVHETLTGEKPEAYAPQRIGLGPYHHFLPELYKKMEQHKLGAAKRVFKKHHQNLDFHSLVVDKLGPLVPVIRSCYDTYLDLEDDTLAWVLAIDGLFFLDLLKAYSGKRPAIRYAEASDIKEWESIEDKFEAYYNCEVEKTVIIFDSDGQIFEDSDSTSNHQHILVDFERRESAKDVFMAENQIPLLALLEIRKAVLQVQNIIPPGIPEPQTMLLYSMLRRFCEAHSPLLLCDVSYPSVWDWETMGPDFVEGQLTVDNTRVHLLEFMYHLIVNNHKSWIELCSATQENVEHVIDFAGAISPTAIPFLLPIKVLIMLPWDKIVALFRKLFKLDEGKVPAKEKIEIPSVSNLLDAAGVTFSLTVPNDGGIRDIEFVEEKRIFYLPRITFNSDSEVILRNLMAYEAFVKKADETLELTEYVELMCGIIHNPKDVKLLREKKVIRGNLGDDEIATLFNGISKSSRKTSEKSELGKTIEQVKQVFR